MSAMNSQGVGSEGKPIYLDQHGAAKATTPATSNSSVDASTNLNDDKMVTKGYVDKNRPTITTAASFTTGTKLGNVTVKNGAGTELSNKDIYAPDATATQKGMLKTVLNASAVGTDASGNLKAITLPTVPTAGFLLMDSSGQRKVRSNINVNDVNAASGAIKPVGVRKDSSGNVRLELFTETPQTPTSGTLISTDGRKVSVKVDDSLVNPDGTVKDTNFLGVLNDRLVAKTATFAKFVNFNDRILVRAWTSDREVNGYRGDVPTDVSDESTGAWRTITVTSTSDAIEYDHEISGTSVASLLGYIYRALTNKDSNGNDVGYTTNPPREYHYGSSGTAYNYSEYGLYNSSSDIRYVKIPGKSSKYYFSLATTPSDETITNENVETRRYRVNIEYRGTTPNSVSGTYITDITRTATTDGNVTTVNYSGTFTLITGQTKRLVYKVSRDCFLFLRPFDLISHPGHSVAAYIGSMPFRYSDIYGGYDATYSCIGCIPVKAGTKVTFIFYDLDITVASGGAKVADISYREVDYTAAGVSYGICEYGFQE